MKRIIVFEGIASSGKTTLERTVAERLPDSEIVTEGVTLMPAIDNTDVAAAKRHLEGVLDSIRRSPARNVILDRFHLTHAFRTGSAVGEFSAIEDGLRDIGGTTVVLLTIDPEAIPARIEETVALRGGGWKKGKQGTAEEKIAYYRRQQETLEDLASSSRLPVLRIDTTAKDWEAYADSIVGRVSS